MKRIIFLVTAALSLLWIGSALLRPPAPVRGFNLDGVGRLPILSNGRIKPLDTVARTTLLQIQGRTTVYKPDTTAIGPEEWLLDLAFNPAAADDYRTFLIDSPEVQALIGQTGDALRVQHEGFRRVLAAVDFIPSKHRRFTFNQIQPHLAEIDRQARLADGVESQLRNPFQNDVLRLYQSLLVYQGVKYSFVIPGQSRYLEVITGLPAQLPAAATAAHLKQEGKAFDETLLGAIADLHQQFEAMADLGSLLAMPPLTGSEEHGWKKTGDALLDTFATGALHPAALTYGGLAQTWREGRPQEFNQLLELYRGEMEKRYSAPLHKADVENTFNNVAPFYKASLLFLLCFLAGLASWLRWPSVFGPVAYSLMTVAWFVTTAGILTRMWLESRPPVTNLYSSALFVGWVAVALCLILERIFRNAIGSVVGGAVGFCALIIAHNLSLTGDTLEMMRAVLDSNFWLATHVVTVTVGYGATFLAGFLGLLFVFMGLFTRELRPDTEKSLVRMVYGIVGFATLFSLIGTVLGGIWADQSWGRFWGWDPKENGALIIVLWNAAILHARWGGMVRSQGLMAMAIFGNVVTAWSWFGTNMLGVGLHSYGFMNEAFHWLVGFAVLNVVVIGLSLLPRRYWRSQPA